MDKLQYDLHIAKEKERMAKGYLTRSERVKLQHMIDNPKEYIKPEPIKKEYKIITNLAELQKPCIPVEKGEDISFILKALKDNLDTSRGFALAANQVGYNKQIAYISFVTGVKDNKAITKEYFIINPTIINKGSLIINRHEGCLSLPGLKVDTDRYNFVVVHCFNEKMEETNILAADLEAIILQHEIGHLQGKTILDFKHRNHKSSQKNLQ